MIFSCVPRNCNLPQQNLVKQTSWLFTSVAEELDLYLIPEDFKPRLRHPNRSDTLTSSFRLIYLITSRRHTWRFYTPIAANLIASENRKRFPPIIGADTLDDFFRRSRRCGSFKNSCDKIAQPDGLALLGIRSNDRRKSRERAHLANAGEFNRRYLTCQISAILYADRRDRRIKSPIGRRL